MKAFLIALIAVSGLTPVTHAGLNNKIDSESSYVRPGPRPGPGGPGPGRPNPGPAPRPNPGPAPRPNPGPAPRPNPPPPPRPAPPRPAPPRPAPPRPVPPPRPQPPVYQSEYVRCDSYNYNYNECYFNSYRVYDVRIYRQHSYETCVWGRNAGNYGDRVWVDRGCSATFEIIRYY
ncbi:MAG: DUF3011 domain-containing protein [Bdellovibrio sp.]